MSASDNRRLMDDLPQIKIFEQWSALLKRAHLRMIGGRPFVLVQNLAVSAFRP
jgi:hypothetical protein